MAIQSGLGQFFAHKLRASVYYEIFKQRGGRSAHRGSDAGVSGGARCLDAIGRAQTGVYVADVAFGHEAQQRGHWSDRLAAIDADITALKKLHDKESARTGPTGVAEIVRLAAKRLSVTCRHEPPASFRPGEPVTLALTASKPEERADTTAQLHYRHVNQAEAYCVAEMESRDDGWQAVIPGDYTRSPFPLEYFFELQTAAGQATLYPGFAPNLCNQPYFVVRQG